jgi:hypothetical protein
VAEQIEKLRVAQLTTTTKNPRRPVWRRSSLTVPDGRLIVALEER